MLPPCAIAVAAAWSVMAGSGSKPCRRADHDVHAGERPGFHQRVRDVVAVADVGDAGALEAPEPLPDGQEIGQGLAGMMVVGEGVDDRLLGGGSAISSSTAWANVLTTMALA